MSHITALSSDYKEHPMIVLDDLRNGDSLTLQCQGPRYGLERIQLTIHIAREQRVRLEVSMPREWTVSRSDPEPLSRQPVSVNSSDLCHLWDRADDKVRRAFLATTDSGKLLAFFQALEEQKQKNKRLEDDDNLEFVLTDGPPLEDEVDELSFPTDEQSVPRLDSNDTKLVETSSDENQQASDTPPEPQ